MSFVVMVTGLAAGVIDGASIEAASDVPRLLSGRGRARCIAAPPPRAAPAAPPARQWTRPRHGRLRSAIVIVFTEYCCMPLAQVPARVIVTLSSVPGARVLRGRPLCVTVSIETAGRDSVVGYR